MENEPTPYDVKRLPREQHEQLKTILQHVLFSDQDIRASGGWWSVHKILNTLPGGKS
jgi:hypothetical protein